MDISLLHGKHLKALIDGHRDNLFREYVQLKPIKLCRGLAPDEIPPDFKELGGLEVEEVLVGFKPGSNENPEFRCFEPLKVEAWPREKIGMSAEVAKWMGSLLEPASPQVGQSLEPKWRKQTIDNEEFPLLSSNSDIDMDLLDLQANNTLPLKTQITLGKRNFKAADSSESEDDEDAGLKWSKKVKNEIGLLVSAWKTEKLSVSRECINYVDSIIHCESKRNIEERERRLLEEDIGWTNLPRSSVTPPLFLASPKLPPYAPFQELKGLFKEDTMGVTTRDLLDEFTNEILAEDQLISIEELENFNVRNIDPALRVPSSPIEIFTMPPTQFGNLIEEMPMTPTSSPFGRKDLRGRVFFKSAAIKLSPIPLPDDVFPSEDDQQEFIENVLKPEALQFTRQLEQEQLQEDDSTMREDMPIMDFSLPDVPWDLGSRSNKDQKVKWSKLFRSAQKLQTGVKTIEMDLLWVAFKKDLLKVALEENIHGDVEEYAEFIVDEVRAGKAEDLLAKAFAILTIDSRKKGLEAGLIESGYSPDESSNIDILVAKWKQEKGQLMRNAVGDKSRTGFDHSQRMGTTTISNYLNTEFSAINNVITFMALRNAKSKEGKGKVVHSSTTPTVSTASLQTPTILSSPTATFTAREIVANDRLSFLIPQEISPPIELPPCPGTFIASTTLLSKIHLYKFILKLYPTAWFLERDFISNFIAPEADLILSPTTGLILTSFQKISQRVTLPGETNNTKFSGIRDRIWDLTQTYEKLIVVVQKSSIFEGQEIISERDQNVIKEFEDFARQLGNGERGLDECEVIPFVVLGEETHMARSVVGRIIEEQIRMEENGWNWKGLLMEEESEHEIFLRSLGLNTYAAQVVLLESAAEARLATDGEDVLNFFLSMDPEWRKLKFGKTVGQRVIRRVNWHVEQWRRARKEEEALLK